MNFTAQLALQQIVLKHLLDLPDGDLMSLFPKQHTDGDNLLFAFTLACSRFGGWKFDFSAYARPFTNLAHIDEQTNPCTSSGFNGLPA